MKRFSFRESLLLCAPIALIGLVFVLPRLLHPPKDPNAVISLSVREKPSNFSQNPRNPRLQFAWEATATGGPQYGCRIGFREEIVAISKTSAQIIYSDPRVKGTLGWGSTGGSSISTNDSALLSLDFHIDGENIPLTATRLEWRGEFVAVPRASGFLSGATSAEQLAKWAKIKGASRVVKTIPIRFDIAKNAILKCETQPVNATNAAHGADTCISLESRDQGRRFNRRLVAFDGHTTRVLWDDNSDGRNPVWQSENGGGWTGFSHSDILFKLRNVPRSWGEIVFLYDVVFVDGKATGDAKSADLKTIAQLEKVGGLRFSRRVVVREKGKTIAAPSFQRTPNLKLTSVQTQKMPQGARILVSMAYTGPRAKPEIDVPGMVELFDVKGESLDGIEQSFGVKSGQKPREWVLEINLSGAKLKPNLACRLEVEIADGAAAPLVVKRNLVLP